MKKLFCQPLSFLACLIFLAFGLLSCGTEGKKSNSNEEQQIVESVEVDERFMDEFNKSKLIFYSLPSPLETAMLIKGQEPIIMRRY